MVDLAGFETETFSCSKSLYLPENLRWSLELESAPPEAVADSFNIVSLTAIAQEGQS